MKEQKWYVKHIPQCFSSTGKPFRVSLKRGTVNKLLINFCGGGLSWSEETAASPISVSRLLGKKDAYYIADVPKVAFKMMRAGLLSAQDARNPFKDWHMLNIPYSTADFHIGNNNFKYSDGKELLHCGQTNFDIIMRDITKKVFPDTPEQLLIAGTSAGGFGCIAHAPAMHNIYPKCKNITIYSEGTHLQWPKWPSVVRDVWKISPELAEHITSDNLILDLLKYAQSKMPLNTQFLHLNSVWDEMLIRFMNKMHNDKLVVDAEAKQFFHSTLKDTVRAAKQEIPNYFYYLTDYGMNKIGTTPHTLAGIHELYHGELEDDISIADWLSKAVSKEPFDVGKNFIEEETAC
ncbi:MAG: pectinacetylesterase family protein [Defluviitaleaceae bacterium]|nr:pectinacetylesterase family protein [Defluviitaleaceae bacterium]